MKRGAEALHAAVVLTVTGEGAMVGRIIALVVALAAVGVFVWGYRPAYEATWQHTMRALGWAEQYERTQPYYQEPPPQRQLAEPQPSQG